MSLVCKSRQEGAKLLYLRGVTLCGLNVSSVAWEARSSHAGAAWPCVWWSPLVLLIACRRRKGGGTNNLCARPDFKELWPSRERSLDGNSCNVAAHGEQAGLRTLPFVSRSRRIKNELSSRQIALRPPKQTANGFSSGTPRAALFFSLFSSFFLDTRTHNNTRSPLSPASRCSNLMKFRRRAHTFTYNTIHFSRTALTY
jgi:hypothetical protein